MMASKLVLRPHPHPLLHPLHLCFFDNGRRPLYSRSTFLSLFSTASSTLSLSQNPELYGPSLRKGRKPSDDKFQHLLPGGNEAGGTQVESGPLIDRDCFTRIFEIAALRVPAARCFALESRLRGHLLNWPRIRNIARVPGDDIEPEFLKLLPSTSSESDEDEKISTSVSRRIYGRADGDGKRLSPVLYRDKLAKSFNCRGFLKFKTLAKISRPTKKKKKVKDKDVAENMSDKVARAGKNDFAVVRVVGEVADESEDMSGLMGERFRAGGWRGPTRLLLLDERYGHKDKEELPESIKVAVLYIL